MGAALPTLDLCLDFRAPLAEQREDRRQKRVGPELLGWTRSGASPVGLPGGSSLHPPCLTSCPRLSRPPFPPHLDWFLSVG